MKVRITVSLMLFFFFAMKVSPVWANTMPFAVEPEFGGNQNKEVTDYFDLTVSPLEETSVAVTIINYSNQENEYEVLLENAFTNQNGLIDFHDKVMKNGLIPDFTSVASSPDKVTVGANSSLTHPIHLKMPDTMYDGVLLGGIRVKEVNKTESKAQVINTYSYLIPIKLHQGKQDYPDILESGKVTIDASHPLHSDISLTLTNPQPDVLRKLQLSVKLKLKNDKSQEWQEVTEKELQMAPLTTTKFPVPLTQPLKAGTYLVKIKGQTTTFEQEWIEELVVDRQTAKITKKQNAKEHTTQFNPIILLLLVIILAQGVIFFRYWRKKNHEKA